MSIFEDVIFYAEPMTHAEAEVEKFKNKIFDNECMN